MGKNLKLKQEIEVQRQILIRVVKDNEYSFQNEEVMKQSKKLDGLLLSLLKSKD